MRTIANRVAGAGVATLALVVLTACGSSTGEASNSGTPGAGSTNPIAVVASTNVWGDIVAQVGGDQVAVTALISDPAADPHSFEPNAQAQLALSKAALVVENGGGYDDFVQTMLDSAGTTAPVINAVEVSGLQEDDGHAEESHTEASEAGADSTAETEAEADHEHGEFNEHVWYDLPTVDAVAARVAEELTIIRPDQAEFFKANLTVFSDRVAGLTAKLDAIKAAHGGAEVAITEPVPLYLTEAAGLVNRTPAEFSEAIEQGTDVPPAVLADTLALFSGQQVVALVYNEQTSSPETEQVLTAARDNSIAVVGVTETLPEGKDYLSWMDSNIAALAGALD
jgi:zinc/manganese transport system substrate-binding protein